MASTATAAPVRDEDAFDIEFPERMLRKATFGPISGTKSPGGTMFTMGTLIMMRVPVSVESAVAA